MLTGPLAAMLLADLGAVVTKFEPPWRDDTRQWGPPYDQFGEATYFQSVNRNKEVWSSISQTTRSSAGRGGSRARPTCWWRISARG